MDLFRKFDTGDDAQKKSHIKNLIKVAAADGHIDDVEIEFLNKIAKRFGIDEAEVKHITDHPTDYPFTPPSDKEDRLAQMANLVRMMLIDNIIDENEMKLCNMFALGLGFPNGKHTIIVKKMVELIQADADSDEIEEEIDDILF